jgi:N-acetylneuraminic acid mutarotase
MKVYKWFFLTLLAVGFVACGDDSDDEYVGNWVLRGEFDGPPRGHAAYFVIGNKGYVVGGYNGYNERRSDVWEYDYQSRLWTRKTDFLGDARQQAVAFSINGKGYVGTGWNGLDSKNEKIMKDFYEFDPAGNGSWRKVASLPDEASERHSAVGFALNGYGYVGTGYTEGADKEALKDFWKYDPIADAWTKAPSYEGNKRYGATVFVIGDEAYLFGGKGTAGTNIIDFWAFDAKTETWRERRKIADNNADEDYDDDYRDLARFYPVSFVMKVEDELRGHIALGSGKSSVWEYNPVTDLWVQRTSYVNNLSPRSREGAISFSFLEANRAFVGLGWQTSTAFSDFREFFPLVEDETNDDD